MQFKGTKGKWNRYTASVPSIERPTRHSVYVVTKRIALCYDLFESDESKNVKEQEAEYNALLISKAPEILEMLKECKLQLEYLNEKFTKTGTTNSLLSKIEQLIKQATDL